MLKKLFSRKNKTTVVSSSDIDFSGYIYFSEFHPGVYRRTPIFSTRNIGNFEEMERRKILSLGGIIEPPRMIVNPSEYDKELMVSAWHNYNQELASKGIVIPEKERFVIG